MLLVLLIPRQALSSHLHVFSMILWESMDFHPDWQLFQVAGARDRTPDPWVTSPTLTPLHHGDFTFLTVDVTVSPLSFYMVSISINLSRTPELIMVLWGTLAIRYSIVLCKWKDAWLVSNWTIFCSTTLDGKNIVLTLFHIIRKKSPKQVNKKQNNCNTLRSLMNELARLTVLNTVERASSFNRDLRVIVKAVEV